MTELLQPPLHVLGGSNQLLEDPVSSPRHQRATAQLNILPEPLEEELFQSGQSVLLRVEVELL